VALDLRRQLAGALALAAAVERGEEAQAEGAPAPH
jgi:hypothetical protein